MRKLLILLLSLGAFILLSCHNKTNSSRNSISGNQKGMKYKQDESYSKKPIKRKVSNYFNKNNKRATTKLSYERAGSVKGKFYFHARNSAEGAFKHNVNQRKVAGKKGFFIFSTESKRNRATRILSSDNVRKESMNQYAKEKRRITKRKLFWFFTKNNKRNRDGTSYDYKQQGSKGAYIFDKKRGRILGSKRWKFFNIKFKREREISGYRGKIRDTKGSYIFNPKKKRVIKKKFLFFFNRHDREKETSVFSGGKTKQFIKFNVFSRKQKTNVHRKGLFRRKSDNYNKRKKVLEQQLFNPRMRVKV